MLSLFRRLSAAPQTETLNRAGVILGDGQERGCKLLQRTGNQLVIVVMRGVATRGPVVVVDLKQAVAIEGVVVSTRGSEARLDVTRSHDLQGLVPARLGRARDVWKRARS